MAYHELEASEIKTLGGHSDFINALAYIPELGLMASGSFDKTIKLWNVKTGALAKTLSGHSDSIHALAYIPELGLMASGSFDKTIKLWNVKTGGLAKTLSSHSDSIYALIYIPELELIASSSFDNTIKLWNVKTGALTKTLSSDSRFVYALIYIPELELLVGGSSDDTIKLWDIKSGGLIKTLSGHSGSVHALTYLSELGLLVSGSSDDTIKLWDIKSGALTKTLDGHAGYVISLIYLPELGLLVSSSFDKTIKLWNIENGTLAKTLIGHRDSVHALIYLPELGLLASGSWDKTIKLWDVCSLGASLNAEISYLMSTPYLLPKSSTGEVVFVDKIRIEASKPLTTEEIEALFFLMPQLPNLRYLILKKCGLTDAQIERIVDLLRTHNKKLTHLNLSNNSITYTGARRLAAGLIECSELKVIDLSQNLISCATELFVKLEKELSQIPSLVAVKVHGNFLDKSCKPLFAPQDLKTGPIGLRVYRFFQTEIGEVTSLLDSTIKISRQNWLVGLLCKRGTEHAMIYMERMRKNGQRVFERYHITAEGIIGIANVHIEEIHLKSFNSDEYYKQLRSISQTNGSILKDIIRAEKSKSLGFSKFYPSSSRGKTNCLAWSLHKLAEVDIHIDRNLLGLPSETARGKCAIS